MKKKIYGVGDKVFYRVSYFKWALCHITWIDEEQKFCRVTGFIGYMPVKNLRPYEPSRKTV